MYYTLRMNNFDTIIDAVESIPENVTDLNLQWDNLDLMTAEKFTLLGDALPATITTIDMLNNHLYQMTVIQLTALGKAIPAGVTSLYFVKNDLNQMSIEQLSALGSSIPTSVTSLYLAENGINQMSKEQLFALGNAIQSSVTSLYILHSHFDSMSEVELYALGNAIPKSITSLYLSANHLDKMTKDQLTTLGNAIPTSVTSLYLHSSYVNHMTGEQLTALGNAIPSSITSLSLIKNYINLMTEYELNVLSNVIPKGVVSLDLRFNNLDEMTDSQLTALGNAIPENVTSLNLRENDLYCISCQRLRTFIQAIPFHVTSIDLRNNELFINKTPAEIDDFLLELGDIRVRLDLSHNGESEFARAVAPLVQMGASGIFGAMLTLPPDITGNIASYLSGLPETSMFRVIKERTEMIGQNRAYIDYINNPSPFPPGVIIRPPREVFSPASEISDEEEHTDKVAFLIEKDIENERSTLYEVPVDSKREDERDSQAVSWMQFICDVPGMPATQLAAIALGVVVLLSCSSVGMLALGTGLTLFGGVGLAINAYHTYCAEPERHWLTATS